MTIPMRTSVVYGKQKVSVLSQLKIVSSDLLLEYMHKLLTEFSQANTVPLRLNHDSPLYKTFAT